MSVFTNVFFSFQAGPLEEVYVPRDQKGAHKYFAIITYVHECSVEYAILLFSGQALFDQVLTIKLRNRGGQTQTRNHSQYPSPNSYGPPRFPVHMPHFQVPHSAFNGINLMQASMLGRGVQFNPLTFQPPFFQHHMAPVLAPPFAQPVPPGVNPQWPSVVGSGSLMDERQNCRKLYREDGSYSECDRRSGKRSRLDEPDEIRHSSRSDRYRDDSRNREDSRNRDDSRCRDDSRNRIDSRYRDHDRYRDERGSRHRDDHSERRGRY